VPLRVVRLGTPRGDGEGLRIGTVRRPPRGIPREQFAAGNWYDVWLPELAPSASLLAYATKQELTETRWRTFTRRYRSEMRRPVAQHLLTLLAALSHRASLSVGCYCENESRCHRTILRDLLQEAGARVLPLSSER
jgi:uncharacterized protein YeaO (DUF488 family)